MRVAFAVVIIGVAFLQARSGQEPLSLVKTIDLPGVEGRIDHLAIDTASQRLFVAALGNNTVEVLDVKDDRQAKSLPGFREPQGIAFVPDLKLVANFRGSCGASSARCAWPLRPRTAVVSPPAAGS